MIEINLIPAKMKKQKQMQIFYMLGAFGAAALLAALSGLYWVQMQKIAGIDREIKKIDAESASLKDKIEEVKKFNVLEDNYNKKKSVLDKLMARQTVWPKILDRISDMVYPDMWITELNYDKSKEDGVTLVLNGVAPSRSLVADFIKRLEESSDISDISAVKVDEAEKYNTGWVVFQIGFMFRTSEKKQAAG